MPGFTQTFGGLTVNPASVPFASYTTATNLVLAWPLQAGAGTNVVAAQNNVSAIAPNLTVMMPDATVATTGQSALFYNSGAISFSVISNTGTVLATIASGQAWYLYLTGNSTSGGTWQVFQFGAGTSSASAASLAGAGLQAATTLLNQNLPPTSLNANYSPGINDRATVLRNTGGAVVYSPASAGTLGTGWFVYVINNGGGTLTWTPTAGQTVDGNATKVLNPTESCIFFSDGANFWSLGYGRSVVSTVTSAIINVAGSGTTTLNANQTAAQVQTYTGALTGNVIINYGSGPGYWFVYNNTSGAFSLTLRVNGSDTGIAVTQGTYTAIRSDGSNITVAQTTTTGTVTSVGTATGELSGGPITTTGTIGLANTAVTPGTYGDASHTVTGTVDAKGRLTSLVSNLISIVVGQIQTFTSAALRAVCSDPTGTGSLVFATSPALAGIPTAPTQALGDNTTAIATDAFVARALTSSPALGGTPTAPTAAPLTNNTQIASTAYADNNLIPITKTALSAASAITGTYPTGTGAAPASGGGANIAGLATTFTPKSASSILEFDISVKGTPSAVNEAFIVALFDGTTLVDFTGVTVSGGPGALYNIELKTWMNSPGTSARNLTVRIGSNNGTTWNINSANNGTGFVAQSGWSSWLTVKEILPHP